MNDRTDNFDGEAPEPAAPFNPDTVEQPVVSDDPPLREGPKEPPPRVNPMPSPPATREHFAMDTGEFMAIPVPIPPSTFDPYDQGTGEGGEPAATPARRGGGRLARSTAFFSIATSFSRIAGLVREIVAASYFGVTGPMSAFTIAFQVPNLVRSLFADAAIQAAFVPVFTEQLEKGNKKEAFRLASTMIFLVSLVLGAITAIFILLAPVIMPIFAPGFEGEIKDLTVTLSQILFPILIVLGATGMVVGVLNSYDRFAAFAISPFFWNVAIIATLVVLAPMFAEDKRIYAYAIGVLVGTVIQFAIPAWDLRHTPFRLKFEFSWNKEVKRVLLLMLPVTISLGLINFNLIVNSFFGTLVSDEAPAAIDKAFRIYMLPQGIFSVAVSTVVFPTLARFSARRDFESLRATMANGMRQIVLLLVPAAAAILVLSEPMIRLVYQRGEFHADQTHIVAVALFWFAFSLPLNGLYLLQTRTFFSLQRPWVPTAISVADLGINVVASWALYKPFGVGGIVAATALATGLCVLTQSIVLRKQLGGIEGGRFIETLTRILLASACLAGVSYGVWYLLDDALGRSIAAQIVSMGAALTAGAAVYFAAARALRIAEVEQLLGLVRRR
jgi:putative peptidoglycan lipid II flippase